MQKEGLKYKHIAVTVDVQSDVFMSLHMFLAMAVWTQI